MRIDASYHQKLQVLKVLRAKTMSEAIQEALDHYFSSVVPEQPRLRDIIARPSPSRMREIPPPPAPTPEAVGLRGPEPSRPSADAA